MKFNRDEMNGISFSLRSRGSNLKVVLRSWPHQVIRHDEVTQASLVLREQTRMFSPHSVTMWISDLGQLPSPL